MIRFKVVRASRLFLILAIVLLTCALVLLGARLLQMRTEAPSGAANLVQMPDTDEAKTTVVFASNDDKAILPHDPVEQRIEIEIIGSAADNRSSPSVLIYHTHTHEAYEQVSEDPYEALEAWRTSDSDHSVVRVGEELARHLRRYGFDVTHDTTDHEEDQLSTAYTRSLMTLQGYNRRFDLYIDLHRDAYTEGEALTVTSQYGEALAPLMLLIGNGNGFDEKPCYEQNYAFARALEERINEFVPGLCKPVLVKDGRYNQHIGVFSVLIEVGYNLNTLQQALDSVSPLAEAIQSLMVESPEPELVQMQTNWKMENHMR